MSDERDPRLRLDPALRSNDVVDPRLVAISLAHELDEREPEPRAQLEKLAAVVGVARCVRLLEQTMCVQDKGGLLAPDGARPRTRGGVFFWLARGSVSKAERLAIWPREGPRMAGATGSDLEWWQNNEAYTEVTRTLLADPGEATLMKVTVIGRPRSITVRTAAVLFVLEARKAPILPKGVPAPQGPPLRCMVVVARKQWERVAPALEDPEDSLIIEGYPTIDPRFAGGLTVHATKVMSKAQSAQARAQQQASAGMGA